MDKREQERALDTLARALNNLDGAKEQVDAAQRQVDEALVAAVEQRAGTRAMEMTELPYATFWRRVKAAHEAVGR